MSIKFIATIEEVGYGLRDFPDGLPGLWFSVTWGSGLASLMAYTYHQLPEFMCRHNIGNAFLLNGKQCYVSDHDGKIAFEGLVPERE